MYGISKERHEEEEESGVQVTPEDYGNGQREEGIHKGESYGVKDSSVFGLRKHLPGDISNSH